MNVSFEKESTMNWKIQSSESKKRKIESSMTTVDDETLPSKVKKSRSSIVENDISKGRKILFTEIGRRAQVYMNRSVNTNFSEKERDPLIVKDIYNLLIEFLDDNLSNSNLRWCTISKQFQVKKMVILAVEGPSKNTIMQNISLLKNIATMFSAVEILASRNPFALDLANIHKMSANIHKMSKYKVKLSEIDQLLLSPEQLEEENYPSQNSVFENGRNYCHTKETYCPLTEDSPMFALDCKMCVTTTRKKEVTRIVIVNENLDVVYNSLVKPQNRIINYLTKYSGLTKSMMKSVTTRLKDVQQDIKNILPSNAILCGQHLNSHLHALQLFHPYIIDTSVIYHSSSVPKSKCSLKQLMKTHLGETIHNNPNGCNPVEDANSIMKLVLLKLQSLGDGLDNSEKVKDDFLSKLQQSSKKVCLIGNKQTIEEHYSHLPAKNVLRISKINAKEIFEATHYYMQDKDLTISNVPFDNESSFSALNFFINGLHNAIPNETLFMIYANSNNGAKSDDIAKSHDEKQNGLCMLALKGSKKK